MRREQVRNDALPSALLLSDAARERLRYEIIETPGVRVRRQTGRRR